MNNPTINETLSYMREEKVKHTKPHQAHYDNVIEMMEENKQREKGCAECNPFCDGCIYIGDTFVTCLECEDGDKYESNGLYYANYCRKCGRKLEG